MGQFSVYLKLGAAVLLYGTALPASRIVTAEVPVLLGTALRMGVAAVIFAPLLWTQRHELRQITRPEWVVVGLIALCGVFVTALMLCSTRVVSCTVICAVTSVTPLATALGAMVFLRDRPNWRQVAWILAAAAASIALKMGCDGGWNWSAPLATVLLAAVLGLTAVACEAAYTLLGKVATRRLSPLTLAALSTMLAALVLVPLAGFQALEVEWNAVSPRAVAAAVWWGAGALAAGSWLWYSGLRTATGSTAAAFMAALPFCTLWLSQVILGH